MLIVFFGTTVHAWPGLTVSGQSVSTPGRSSASRSKIWVDEPDQEGDNSVTWQKLNGHALISGEKLREQFDEAVTCRFCQGSVHLLENVENKNGLGSTRIVQYHNESCLSRQTYLVFSTTEKSRTFDEGRTGVFSWCVISLFYFSWIVNLINYSSCSVTKRFSVPREKLELIIDIRDYVSSFPRDF